MRILFAVLVMSWFVAGEALGQVQLPDFMEVSIDRFERQVTLSTKRGQNLPLGADGDVSLSVTINSKINPGTLIFKRKGPEVKWGETKVVKCLHDGRVGKDAPVEYSTSDLVGSDWWETVVITLSEEQLKMWAEAAKTELRIASGYDLELSREITSTVKVLYLWWLQEKDKKHFPD